ncbi:MAG TPA: helix-hairpin-helix domain-containing protein [Candidatus Limnocylindria bacterium]|nr:helix-hairpin-helix domain-containing protein [Candidatus Limnocylindria bacterium]
MRALIAIAAAGVVAALILLHPAAPPPAAAVTAGWGTAAPEPRRAAPSQAPAATVTVYVAGEVVRPGVYAVRAGARVQDALLRAGGLRADADPVAVNLAERLRDGEEVAVPARGAPPVGRARRAAAPHPRRGARGPRRRATAPAAAVDLNAADASSLAALPGIGRELAARIVAFRELNGPFASPDELLDVSGITEHRYDAIAPYVTVR